MFDKLRRARSDLTTMNTLFPAAERIARDDGVDQPGAEHLLLAAIDLDDGIARSALAAIGVDAAGLRAAIVRQHEEALSSIGVIADDNAIAAAMPASGQPSGPYRAQGSQQAAFQQAVSLAKDDNASLNSGYLLLAITEAEHGTVARALQQLGADRMLLRDNARRILEGSMTRS
jgi:ATP-dependent Clp protease ATP-binding subunit ClpA